MKKKILIGVLCIIAVFLIICILRMLEIIPAYKTKNVNNYDKFINKELEYSDIFPEKISDDVKAVNFTYAEYITILWDNYLCYLDVKYEPEEFEAEIARISGMSAGMDLKCFEENATNDILYCEDYFTYPAYVECLDNSGGSYYSYALIDEEECRIIYIYINGIIESVHLNFIKEFMPKGYSEAVKEGSRDYSEMEYSMYKMFE